jgi:phage minor structural protein
MILYEKGSTTAEASGTTFTLQDTSNERKLSFKKYYGNTTQETTSGKNIFNKDETPQYSSGYVSSTPLDTGIRVSLTAGSINYRYTAIKLGGSELLGKTITLYSKITASASNIGSIYLYFGKNGGSSAIQVIGTRLVSTGSKTYEIPSSFPSGADIINVLFYANVNGSPTASGDYVDYTNLQIEIGSQATSYEPYTHGATPNPYYPQPINVVTGGNTISVVGKNLFDVSKIETGYGNVVFDVTGNVLTLEATGTTGSQYVKTFVRNVDNTKTYTLSFKAKKVLKGTSGQPTIRVVPYGSNDDVNYTSLGYAGMDSPVQSTEYSLSRSYTGYKYYRFYIYNNTSSPVTVGEKTQYWDIQFEEGNQATTYEDYIGRDYEVNLGKNLAKIPDGDYTIGTTPYVVENGIIKISAITEANKNTYFPSFKVDKSGIYTYWLEVTGYTDVSSGRAAFQLQQSSDNSSFSNIREINCNSTSQHRFEVTLDNTKYYRIRFYTSNNTFTNATIKVQLERGIDKTSFAPYKTPIELNKIGTYQDIIFKSSGKNLFNGNIVNMALSNNIIAVNSSYRGYYTTCKEGDIFSVSRDSLSNNRFRVVFSSEEPANNVETFGGTGNVGTYDSSLKIENIVAPQNANYIFIYLSNQSDTIPNIMLNEGTTALPYEPYGKDYYIKKEIGKVVLDGSENWGLTSSSVASGTKRFYYNDTQYFNDKNVSSNIVYCLSNMFKGIGWTSMYSTDTTTKYAVCLYCDNTGLGRINLRIEDTIASDVTTLKSWLGTNKPIVYYVLNTPTYTKVTGELLEQIEALENATTYDNVTNILQSNTDLPLYVDIEYLQPLDFSRNGLGYLPNVLNAYVTDEINGEYSLTFEYPIEDRMASEIVEDRIVKCKVADGSNQCFIIKKIQKNFDKMNVYCTHLFYMLYDDFLEDTYPQNLSPKPFLDHILSRANYQLPFVANSDIATTKTARYVRKNVVETILGNINNSMYNLWGLELKRDNWNIGLKARLGSNKGEKLIFGKNITGVDVSVDTTGIYTRIMPIGFDGLILPEKYIDAPNINEYPYPRICLYEFSNIRYDANEEDTEAYHTLDEAYQALRDATQELFDKGINKPKINIKVDWLELSKTKEFKQYSALERVDLGDTLTSNLFGMDYETRVIKTIYNPLNDRIEQFEIGTFKPSITTEMNQLNFDVVNLPSSMLDEAQANATQLITQAMGGYVYKTNSELYIMDNPDPNQAVKVWRWNINGLGYSSTGINGTYGIAMTMDGSIVADFITTGQLNANVISASTIIGVINGNTSQLKLEADQLDLNGAVTANNNFKIKDDGSVEINNGSIELTDDGEQTIRPRISVSWVNHSLVNELYSSGLYITLNDGLEKRESSITYSGYNHMITSLQTNRKQFFEQSFNTIYMCDFDENGNTERSAFLFPGADTESAFKLGYGSTTNVEITNHQSGSLMTIRGSIETTDNNGNITFTIDGSKGGIISNNDTTSVNSQTVVDGITIKRAGSDYSPGNGVVIETSLFNDWGGQLYIGDNATQGIWFSGWSNGVKSSWKKLALEDSWTGTFTATKSSGNGNVTSANYVRASNTIQLDITFNTSGGSTSVGSNVWVGTLSDIPLPKALISGCGFYGSTMYVGTLETNGTFTIRALGSTSAQNSNDHVISFTYII